MSFTKAIEKQDIIISFVNNMFTRRLISQTDNGDGTVKFETDSNHNFISGDYIVLYETIDADNNITKYSGYDTTLTRYKILSVFENTFTIELTYNSEIDITKIYARSVFVYNNDEIDIRTSKKYPILFVVAKDTFSIENNSNEFIPAETEFVLTMCDALAHHQNGDNTQIRSSRLYCETKLNLILDNINKKIVSNNIRRGEFKWYNIDISFIDVVIED